MPAMPRIKGKATKIAYAILGKPQNLKHTKTDYKIDKRLEHEDTRLVR